MRHHAPWCPNAVTCGDYPSVPLAGRPPVHRELVPTAPARAPLSLPLYLPLSLPLPLLLLLQEPGLLLGIFMTVSCYGFADPKVGGGRRQGGRGRASLEVCVALWRLLLLDVPVPTTGLVPIANLHTRTHTHTRFVFNTHTRLHMHTPASSGRAFVSFFNTHTHLHTYIHERTNAHSPASFTLRCLLSCTL